MTRAPLPLALVIEPGFAEEAVLRAVVGHPEDRTFRRARDPLYLLPDGDARERDFQELHVSWFARLGLAQPLHAALAELPLLAERCTRCLVSRAPTARDEGADLLVNDEAGVPAERTVLIRLRPAVFQSPERLLALLRGELLHVADMVDPAFGYQPAVPPTDGGPGAERLLRDRYRLLWDVSIAGRLVRRGCGGPDARAAAFAAFATAFPMLGAGAEDAFARLFDGEAHTHDALMAFAAQPRGESMAPGLAPGGRCPLCRFPTYAPEPDPDTLPANVAACITADFPAWLPSHGLCRQCADLYRARTVETAA
jgi:hypothetical protein